MERTIGRLTLRLTRGDITRLSADAVVNAANEALAGGGGVDGAIRRAGGPEIMLQCRQIGRCSTGDAVATTAGNLHARHVIHAVAPIWRGGTAGEPELLRSAYQRSLEVADELGDRTICFPSLGTGAYGYPIDRAARIAVQTVLDYSRRGTEVEGVTFVLFSDADLEVYRTACEDLLGR